MWEIGNHKITNSGKIALLVIMEIKVRATLLRLAKLTKSGNIKYWQGRGTR